MKEVNLEVFDVLFDGKADEFSKNLLSVMMDESCPSEKWVQNTTKDILKIMRLRDNYNDVARTINAVAAHSLFSYSWLDALKKEIEACAKQITIKCFSSTFVLGCVLGFFKTAVWFDRNFEKGERSETGKFCGEIAWTHEFPKILTDFIIPKNQFTTGIGKNLLDTKFESVLSQVIKEFVRGGDRDLCRFPTVNKILDRVFRSTKGNSENISELGMLILNQLMFGVFGHLTFSQKLYSVIKMTGTCVKNPDQQFGHYQTLIKS